MDEHPILFSGPMVRAILDGRKTMTRRVLKLPAKTMNGLTFYEHPQMGGWAPTTTGGGGSFYISRNGEKIPVPERVAIWHQTCGDCIVVPHQIGDRLWIRESWRVGAEFNATKPSNIPQGTFVLYEADNPAMLGKLRPGIFMPRWASRITLEVTGVKVERLQYISEEDAEAEGVFAHVAEYSLNKVFRDQRGPMAIKYFSELWERINGPGSWDTNPWVAAYTFRRVKP